jgi:hypothetical protein
MLRRRNRKRRNQRIAAGVVGIAVFIGAVVIVASSPFDRTDNPAATGVTAPRSTPVGFIGIPPEGTTPSSPAQGELVISAWGTAPDVPRTVVFVYADGRVIWRAEANLPYGANGHSTGFLEQRLTPEGVELLRSEVLASGLVEQDALVLGIGEGEPIVPYFNFIEVRDGDRVATLRWTQGDGVYHRRATPEEVDTIFTLVRRLAQPGSWLPASAWEDQEIRGYVPSRYEVCIESLLPTRFIPPGEVANELPERARDAFGSLDWAVDEDDFPTGYCADATTDDARALADALDEAALDMDDFERDRRDGVWRLTYRLSSPGLDTRPVWISFEPYLPHGEAICSTCG